MALQYHYSSPPDTASNLSSADEYSQQRSATSKDQACKASSFAPATRKRWLRANITGRWLRALQWPCLQEAVEKREAEIVRLGAEAGAGRDVDVTALQYRSEAQENLILQLNEQVRLLALLKCPSHSS